MAVLKASELGADLRRLQKAGELNIPDSRGKPHDSGGVSHRKRVF
jgi:hypothetical protein